MAYASRTSRIKRQIRDAAVERVEGALEIIERSIEARTPRRTGKLAGSYEIRVRRERKRVRGEVGTPLFYAIFPEFRADGTPYFRPGFQDAREEALAHLSERWF